MTISISLSPEGNLHLFTEDWSIDLPPSMPGLQFLISILEGHQAGQTKLAQSGAPTQWEIEAAIKRWKPHPPKEIEAIMNVEVDL